MTLEEIEIWRKVSDEILENKKTAAKILNPKGLNGYVMHHIDPTLQQRDPVRYHEWRPEDLVLMTRSEHSRLHMTGRMASAKVRKQCGDRFRGKAPWNKGKTGLYTPSAETRAKISAAKKGHTFTPEQLEKIRLAGERKKGKIFANDGKVNRMFFPNEVPEGWVIGKLKRSRVLG